MDNEKFDYEVGTWGELVKILKELPKDVPFKITIEAVKKDDE